MKKTMIANRSLLFAAALTAVLGMTLPVSAGVLFSDNFTGNTISPDWATGPSWSTIEQTGGQLVTTVVSTGSGQRAMAATVDQTAFNFFNQPMDVTVNIASWGTPTVPTGATVSSSNYYGLIGGNATGVIKDMDLGDLTGGVGVMILQSSAGTTNLWLGKKVGSSRTYLKQTTLAAGTTTLKFTMHMDATDITVTLLNGATFASPAALSGLTSFTVPHGMFASDFTGGYRLILGSQNNRNVGAKSQSVAHYEDVSVSTPIPEPATLALLMSGGLLIVSRRRQSQRKN